MASAAAAPVTAARAVANYKASSAIPGQIIVDGSDGINLFLDKLTLLAAAGNIVSIMLTDTRALSLSYTSHVANAQVLGMLGEGVGLTLSGVPAAGAARVQADTRVKSFTVADSASAVAGNLDALNAAARLSAIVLTSGANLSVAMLRLTTDAGALARITSPYTLTVTGVTLAGLAGVKANTHVNAIQVADSAAAVAAGFAILNATPMVSVIAVTGEAGLTLGLQTFWDNPMAVARLDPGVAVTVANVVTPAGVLLQANARVGTFTVADAGTNIQANLDILNGQNKLTAITVTDQTPILLTYARYLADLTAVGKFVPGTVVNVLSVTAAGAAAVQANSRVTSFRVIDTVTGIAANLDALNTAGKLTVIELSAGGVFSLTYPQWLNDTAALGKLPAGYIVSISGVTAAGAAAVQASSHVRSFTINDTAASIAAAFETLSGAGKLSAITLTNTAPIVLTDARFANGTALLNKIASNYSLTITDTTAAGAAIFQTAPHVAAFSVSDLATNVMANLAALNAATRLTGITLTNNTALTLTPARMDANAAALAKLPANYTVTLVAVTAAEAGAAQASSHVTSFSITDQAAAIAAVFDMLSTNAKLTKIVVSDGAPMALTAAQFNSGLAMLAKLPEGQRFTVAGSAASGAASLQANARVTSFTVRDTGASVVAGLSALNAATKLRAIVLTDTRPMVLTQEQLAASTGVIAKIQTNQGLIVTGATASDAGMLQNQAMVKSFTLTDTAANVAAAIDRLNGYGKLTEIKLSDVQPLPLTFSQYSNDTAALSKLIGAWMASLTGVSATGAAAAQADTHVKTFTVLDTAAAVTAQLDALNGDGKLTAITLTGGAALTLAVWQLTADAAALDKIKSPYRVTVANVAVRDLMVAHASPNVTAIQVTDTAANIAGGLDALNADGKLTAIQLSDTVPLSLPYAKFMADGVALSKIAGAHTLTVTGVPAAGAAGVAANTHAGPFTVTDTLAGIGAKLDQLEVLAKAGKLSGITVSDTGGAITLTQTQYTANADAIALMKGAFTINHPAAAAASGATINLIWDGAALAAPASFRLAVTYTAQYFQSLIVNPITLNLRVGYGEVAGSPLGSGVLGAAGPDRGIGRSYTQFRNDLMTHDTSATTRTIVSNLPAADPFHGGNIYLSSAEAKALGLMNARDTTIDGSMGFAADPNGTLWATDPNNRAVPGKYDLIGVVQHELSHALGRIAIGGTYGDWISALDVFRYAAPGTHSPNAGANAYFSIDGGATNLNWFASSSDLGDWASSAGADANVAYSSAGVAHRFTQADITQLNALGFATSGTIAAAAFSQVVASAAGGLNAPGLNVLGSPTIAFMNGEAPLFDASISPPEGIEQIAQFVYGVNQLRIDLLGLDPAAFRAFDTSVEGQHAIALTSRADPTHGIVLTRMDASHTAADLMTNHLSFRDGHAIIA